MRGNWEDAAVDQGRLKPSSLKYLLSRRLETYIADRSNRLACICEGLRADLASRVCDKNKDIVVFPNAVEMGDFPVREPDQGLIRKLGLQGKSVVAYLGSLSHWEGVEVLVNAFSKVAKEISNAILLVIGGGDVEETIRQRMADSPMRDSMRFIGRVPHREVASYYSVINLLVYPRVSSRNTELCTPLKPLEAMAMGKPILVSDVGGLKELVPLSGNCCFPAGSSEHLSELIIQFLRDPDRLEKLGESGREHVMLGRQWSQAIGRYKDVYELLLRS
jgi:glycosyltransferase involved in cell wall biosynthesis